uniref:ARID domain-containing protein n=1 Tax=Gouania willdenowi TaxID=441366 RepID=A0A8C5GDU9_GOUWI
MFQTLEEPPYLTVGTDVSAKYRGAFCEAKIKTAKRLVKAKVTFKPDLSTAEVHDENIKGPLKVGAVVEVKNQDGVYQEATINKLTDASIYTVVFDDGDEKTLRRSSLCLKGARHFAESESLDRLPLTNPEHFGTPVIGKKGNRGRRSNPIQEEELSSSSSEEEESDQRQNEDLFGKVVCVEGVAAGDKKKTTWYPALVISPDCNEDVTVKKDNIYVRSFKDGKFVCTGLCFTALDAAVEFQQQQVVPSSWKTEVKEESSSSEEDDDDEEEEQEEDASGEEEEEVEPFPEERENFLQQLYKFMEDRGTPINKRPVLGYKNLNLFKLYRLVHKLGGFDNIESGAVWKQVYQDLGIPVLNSAAGYNVKCAYRKYLNGFEEYCTSTAITFRMDLPLKQAKSSEEPPRRTAHTTSSPEEQITPSDKEASSAQAAVCKGQEVLNCFSCRDDSSQEGEEGEEFECYPPGMKVQVRYGRGRNLKTYEATVKEADVEGGEVLYLVHYCGWNVRYDEWIKADKIVRPANKNVPKIKHRKKIKRLNDRDHLGSPSNSPRVTRPKCGLSQDVFSKMDEGEDKGTQLSPVKSIEITSILNGLQASEVSTDESDQEHGDDDGEHVEEKLLDSRDNLRKGPSELLHITEQHRECAPTPNGSKPSPVSGKNMESVLPENTDVGKRRNQQELEVEAGSPRKQEDRASSSSSEDEAAALIESQVVETERSRPKNKGSPSKKYNGMKEKNKSTRQAAFWEIPEKRAKVSGNAEERPLVRPKGQKDVWSSIQAQWPKKTLKELFSDSDTEAANSPPPPVSSCLEEPSIGEDATPEDEVSEEQMDNDKLQEFPSSGSNSLLNTPPTTPESPSGGGSAAENPGHAPPSPTPPSAPSEEVAGGRSETDSSTVEVESLGGELQDLPVDEGASSPSKVLEVSLSCNSSSCSLELSSNTNSSDSEDQSVIEAAAKPSKNHTADLKGSSSPKCPGRSPPSSHKYHKHGDVDHTQHRDHHCRSQRVYKWSFQMSDLEKMSSLERISFLQEKLQDIRNHYLSLKSEVASIDRRRKRMKKKEQETAASSSSSSSSPSSSSLTAAVMLTLADPPVSSSSSSSQNSGVSVECR